MSSKHEPTVFLPGLQPNRVNENESSYWEAAGLVRIPLEAPTPRYDCSKSTDQTPYVQATFSLKTSTRPDTKPSSSPHAPTSFSPRS